MKFGVKIIYKMLSGKRDFREDLFSDTFFTCEGKFGVKIIYKKLSGKRDFREDLFSDTFFTCEGKEPLSVLDIFSG